MQKLGRIEEGIKLPDGGYFGTLAVYHDLHCLVSSRPYAIYQYGDHQLTELSAVFTIHFIETITSRILTQWK